MPRYPFNFIKHLEHPELPAFSCLRLHPERRRGAALQVQGAIDLPFQALAVAFGVATKKFFKRMFHF